MGESHVRARVREPVPHLKEHRLQLLHSPHCPSTARRRRKIPVFLPFYFLCSMCVCVPLVCGVVWCGVVWCVCICIRVLVCDVLVVVVVVMCVFFLCVGLCVYVCVCGGGHSPHQPPPIQKETKRDALQTPGGSTRFLNISTSLQREKEERKGFSSTAYCDWRCHNVADTVPKILGSNLPRFSKASGSLTCATRGTRVCYRSGMISSSSKG